MGYDGPVVDPHVHLQLDEEMRWPETANRLEDYQKAIDGLGIRSAAVLVMAPAGDPDRTRVQNDLALALRSPELDWFALCSVHPYDGEAALAEVDRVVAAGAAGLKLHPNTQDFDVADERVAAVVARAAELGVPVLFDAYSPFDANQPGKFVRLALAQPEARIVLAHMLGPRFIELLVYEILARIPIYRRNVWFDLSYAAAAFGRSPYRDQFAWVAREVGIDRLLFASDFPADQPADALAAVRDLFPDQDEQRRILHDNAADLFGLRDR